MNLHTQKPPIDMTITSANAKLSRFKPTDNLGYTMYILVKVYFMNSSIGQWGNSLAVRLPRHILQSLDLKVNDRLSITEVEGKIVLEPLPKLEELSLDFLLSQITEPPESEIDWGQPEGEEFW